MNFSVQDQELVAASLVVIGTLILYGFWYLNRIGMYKCAKVEERVLGPYLVVYKNYVGAYNGVGNVFCEVCGLCVRLGWDETRGKMLGAYFDNPSEVEGSKCRSSIGAIWCENLSEEEMKKMKQELLAYQPFIDTGLKVAFFPRSMSYVVKFPFKGMWSILLAVQRGYPALAKYMVDKKPTKNCSSIEVYDHNKGTMLLGFSTMEREELLPFEA